MAMWRLYFVFFGFVLSVTVAQQASARSEEACLKPVLEKLRALDREWVLLRDRLIATGDCTYAERAFKVRQRGTAIGKAGAARCKTDWLETPNQRQNEYADLKQKYCREQVSPTVPTPTVRTPDAPTGRQPTVRTPKTKQPTVSAPDVAAPTTPTTNPPTIRP